MSQNFGNSSGPFDILLVCTGNQCRSPMAAAVLAHLLAVRGSGMTVGSAGFVSPGVASPAEAVEVMNSLGYDLSAHRSKAVSPALLDSAQLVVGMTRQHAVDLSLRDPSVWPRSFTLAEVVRLGGALPARRPDEALASWAARIGAGRRRSGILDLPLSEDVQDPIGRPMTAYIRTRDRLVELVTRLADLVEPV